MCYFAQSVANACASFGFVGLTIGATLRIVTNDRLTCFSNTEPLFLHGVFAKDTFVFSSTPVSSDDPVPRHISMSGTFDAVGRSDTSTMKKAYERFSLFDADSVILSVVERKTTVGGRKGEGQETPRRMWPFRASWLFFGSSLRLVGSSTARCKAFAVLSFSWICLFSVRGVIEGLWRMPPTQSFHFEIWFTLSASKGANIADV